MFVGFVDLEGTLVWPVLTVNGSDVPTNADSAPTYSIYSVDMSSALTTGTTSAVDGVTGGYYGSKAIAASAGFAAGRTYTILVSWAISSSARRAAFTFTVT